MKKRVIEKKKNNRGAALMVAVIIIGILVVFTFSLLLVSYTLFASQNKKAASIRCSEAANTMSRAMEKELTDADAYLNSDLWNYLRFNLIQGETWPYYDENGAAGHTAEYAYRYFTVDYNTSQNYLAKYANNASPEGYPAKVQLCIYWMPPVGFDEADYSQDKLSNLEVGLQRDIRLFIEITCESGNQSYTVLNEYRLTASEFKTDELPLKETLQKNATLRYSKGYSASGKEIYMYNPHQFINYHGEYKWEWEWVSRK